MTKRKLLNKQAFIDNVLFLARTEHDMGIGEFEDELDVSRGYFSRLSKNNNLPSLHTVTNVANILDMSIDTLLYMPIMDLTKDEKRLIGFVESMIRRTQEGKLVWDRMVGVLPDKAVTPDKPHEDVSMLRSLLWGKEKSSNKVYVDFIYHNDNLQIWLTAEGWLEGNPSEYKLYDSADESPIYETPMQVRVQSLEKLAEESANRIQLPDPIINIIDSFMQEWDDDEDAV